MAFFAYKFIKTLSQDAAAVSQTVDAGAEVSILTITGEGYAAILFLGDGGATLRMRVYSDGLMIAEVPANAPNSVATAFTSSLEIRAFNPSTASVTENSSGFRIRGGLF